MNSHQRRVLRRRSQRLNGAAYGRLYIALHSGVPSAATELPVGRVAVVVRLPGFASGAVIDGIEVAEVSS